MKDKKISIDAKDLDIIKICIMHCLRCEGFTLTRNLEVIRTLLDLHDKIKEALHG